VQLPITISIGRQQPLARLFCRGDITALTLYADGRLLIERNDGMQLEAVVEPESTQFTCLLILRLRVNDRVESLVLPRAAIGAEAHRRLRVWLKWKASAVA
jgi:hypothetical protein